MIDLTEMARWWSKSNEKFKNLGEQSFAGYPKAAYDNGVIAMNFIAVGAATLLSIAADVRAIREGLERKVI